jgi:NitT/TauT family transport system substrate-binding protein
MTKFINVRSIISAHVTPLRVALVLTPCVLTALAGCSPKSAPSSSSTPASAPAADTASKPFVVGYNQWIGLVGVFMAKDKGYFKDAGLDVEFKQFSGPADPVPPMLTGQLDGAMTTADTPILLSKSAESNPLKDVWITDTSDGADGIIADKSIATVKDLKGKTIAATKGQVNEYLLLKALTANGMTEDDLTVVNMDADSAGAAMVAHKVPAAVTWEPWLSKAAGGGGHVIYSSKEAPNAILDVFTVPQNTIDARPDDVKKFVAACAKGADYANSHVDEAAQTAAKYFGTTEKDAKVMLTKVKVYGADDNRKLMGTPSAPGPAFKTANEISQFFVAQKVIPEAPDTSKMFTTDYLP